MAMRDRCTRIQHPNSAAEGFHSNAPELRRARDTPFTPTAEVEHTACMVSESGVMKVRNGLRGVRLKKRLVPRLRIKRGSSSDFGDPVLVRRGWQYICNLSFLIVQRMEIDW